MKLVFWMESCKMGSGAFRSSELHASGIGTRKSISYESRRAVASLPMPKKMESCGREQKSDNIDQFEATVVEGPNERLCH